MERTEIIAEIGWAWLGDFGLAEDMIAAAASSGADYIKTQTWKEKNLKSGPWDTDGRRALYKRAQLDTLAKQWRLMELCDKYNIKYLTSVFSVEDLDIVPDISVIKIPGIESDNTELLNKCLSRFNKVFLSVAGRDVMTINVNSRCIVMPGVYLYPCPINHANLWQISSLKERYKYVGYSDHTTGVAAPFAAIGMGISSLEKHFTIDNSLEGRDNSFACLPDTLKQICQFRDDVHLMHKQTSPDDSSIQAYKGRWSS